MMTKEAIKKEMDKIERRRWLLSMKDRWTREDDDFDNEMLKKWIDLNEILKKLEA